jgi:indolepyruvate decarboxylase
LGGVGQRVTTRQQLKEALDRAVAARGTFQLIEVMLARGAISQTLSRFVAAITTSIS